MNVVNEMPIPGESDIETAENFLDDVQKETTGKHTVVNEPEPEPAGEATEPGRPKAKKAHQISANLQAKLWLNAFDGLQAAGFTIVHEKKKRREIGDDMDSVEVLDEQLKDKVVNVDEAKLDPLYSKVRKLRRRNKIIDDLPLSDEEKQGLMEPLEQMIAENGYQMPAWLGLTLAFGQIVVFRMQSAIMD
jgi:hypothetical protein